MKLYEVGVAWQSRDRWLQIFARNSTEAKRKWCKLYGRKASDPWGGISILKARQVKG